MREQIAQHAYPSRLASTTTAKQPILRPPDVAVASPHRAGHSVGMHPEDQPYQSNELRQRVPSPLLPNDEEEDEDYYPQRTRSSVIVRRRLPTTEPGIGPQFQATPGRRPRRRGIHRLMYIGIGMLCTLVLLVVLSDVFAWWQHTQDDWHYGYPRTYQADAVVGHHDSAGHPSHFIALNLHGRIEVIELPGGDASQAVIYVGPALFGTEADQVPVTLTFADVNRDGKPDMELHEEDNVVVFLNNGKTFQQSHP